MKYLLPILALSLSLPAFSAPPAGYPETLVTFARATGLSYQFGTRCGIDEELLRKYKSKYETQTRTESLRLYPKLDIDAEYQRGVDEGERFYNAVKDPAYQALVCGQMKEKIQLALASPK